MYPVVIGVNAITNSFMRILGVNPKQSQMADALSWKSYGQWLMKPGNLIPTSHQEMLVAYSDLEKGDRRRRHDSAK